LSSQTIEAEKREAEAKILRWEEEDCRKAAESSKKARIEKAMHSILGKIRASLAKPPDKA
jgi:hypothetical protein